MFWQLAVHWKVVEAIILLSLIFFDTTNQLTLNDRLYCEFATEREVIEDGKTTRE